MSNRWPLALFCGFLLTACATSNPAPRVVTLPPVQINTPVYPQMPDLTCPLEPPVPATITTDAEFGGWTLDILAAYRECAAKLGNVRDYVATWPH